MSLSETISAIASAIAALTTILVLLTLIEMRAQRRAAHRPELVPASSIAFAIFYRTGKYVGLNSFYLCSARIDPMKPEPPDVLRLASLRLEIRNIGLAAAKSIEIEWDFSLAVFRGGLRRFDPLGQIAISEREGFVTISFPKYGLTASYNTARVNRSNADYLPSADGASGTIATEVPGSYLHLLMVIEALALDSNNQHELGKYFGAVPPLLLRIRYGDIENVAYRKEFHYRVFLTDIIEYKWPIVVRRGKTGAARLCGGLLEMK